MSTRRWLRPKPRISYFEPEEPNLDEYVFCEKCGDFVYEYCSIHGALLVIPDDKVPAKHNFPSFVPRAALTIPKVFLHLNYSSIPGAGVGVFATLTLPKGVRFGPYRGVKTKEVASDYCWQMYDSSRRPTHVVDGCAGAGANWMRFVNCARHWAEQNMLAFQYRGEIYYRTIKIIPRFTELLVFYGCEFAKKLDINLGKYNAPKSYAQKFGAHVPKQPKVSPENKKTKGGSVSDAKEQERDILQPTSCTTLTAIPEKKNNRKRPKENQLETQNEAPAVKKRKTKTENKKLQPEKTNIEAEAKISRETVKEHVMKPSKDAVQELKNKETDKNTKIESAKAKGEEKLENELPKKLPPEENITNSNSDFTKHVGNTVTSNDKNIEKGHVSANNQQQKMGKTQSNEQSADQIITQDVYFTCNECNYQGVTKELLEIHLRFHDVNRKFACKTCGYRFSSSQSLNSHESSHETDTSLMKIFKCNICDYATVCGGALKRHLNLNKHNHERCQACNLCGCKFTRASNLITHRRIHTGENPYKCDICDYKCSQLGNLQRHKRIHTGEKPYKCDICDYKCSQLGSLQTHKRIHTGEKPYKCDICDHKCSQLGSLQTHKRIHTGEKPYKCDICDHKCSRLGSLQTHKRIHTGEKPYKCDICDYKCSQLGHLQRHKRIHTGEKPYKCDICDYKCSYTSSLQYHLKKKHLS